MSHRLEPARDPRPQEDGTYRCYHDGCRTEADVAVPRRIESTGMDPVETGVTVCFEHWLAWQVLKDTGQPLEAQIEIHEDISAEFDREGWVDVRATARALAYVSLYGHPLGEDRPSEDSPLGDDWDHAGDVGERLREHFETPVEEQLWAMDYPDTPDRPPGHDSSSLEDFEGSEDV